MTGARARHRAEVEAALLAAGRRELSRAGAAGLSVRGVARDLGMAPSALFRYISGRDELLTRLIVDAYDDLGAFVEVAEARVPRTDHRGRWRAIAGAFREWAAAHPHEYALLYGSPVPGYHAPAERTEPVGTRVTNLLIALGRDAAEPARPAVVPGLPDAGRLATLTTAAGESPEFATRFTAGLLAWTTLVGAVSSDRFEQVGEDVARLGTLTDAAVALGEWLMFGD